MSSYKLTYFPLTGLGETIRWLLAINKIEFEDIHVSIEDFFPTVKAKTPFGKLPILEVDGKELTQSSAICRWLAKKANLTGKNDDDALQADIIVDTIGDLKSALVDYFWDSNEETKAAKRGPLEKTVPFYLTRLDKIVEDNNGYFVNGQLTWADVYYISFADYLQKMSCGMDFFTDYPNLAALKKKIVEIPEIKAWIAKRTINS